MKTSRFLFYLVTFFTFALPQFSFSVENLPSTKVDQSLEVLQHKIAELKNVGSRPRIVVFWASFGFGHLSAALAVKQDVQTVYPTAEVVLFDVLGSKPEWRRNAEEWIYDRITKHAPAAYDKIFLDYMHKGAVIESLGDMTMAKKQRPDVMLQFIRDQRATMIFSVFNHATEALIHLRDQGQLNDIPIAQVLTDYVSADYFRRMGERLEISFVPHQAIAQSWINAGFPANKVRASGIPVAKSIFTEFTKAQSDAFLIERGLDPKIPIVLLVSGSAGVGNFPVIVKSIIKENKNIQVVVVTAKNKGHFKSVSKIVPPDGTTIKVLGRVPNEEMIQYMKSASILVTKTGGLTASEVIAMGKPTVFLDINGGQETFNSDFMKSSGMGLATKNQNEVGKLVHDLWANEPLRLQMIQKQNESQTTIDRAAVLKWIMDFHHKKMINDIETSTGKPYLQAISEKLHQQKAYLMSDKEEVARARRDLVNTENKEIFAAYLLFDGNKAGRVALAAALEARRRGVRVRIVVDGFQMAAWMDSEIDKATMAALIREGVEIRLYMPINLKDIRTYLNPDIFNRLHDKLLYLGGQEVLFTGDRNMQNINFGLQRTKGQAGRSYISIETIVKGSVVTEAKNHLEDVWEASTPPDVSDVTEEEMNRALQRLQRMSVAMRRAEIPVTDWMGKLQPVDSVEFLADHPKEKGKQFPLDTEIENAINSAKERVDIISPYINLPAKLRIAIAAALKRGVVVRIFTASKENTDAWPASVAFSYQAVQLEKMGVQVYQVIGKDFLHAKGLRVDNAYSFITGHNFNERSRSTDIESAVVIRGKDYAGSFDQFLVSLTPSLATYESAKVRGGVAMCKQIAVQVIVKLPLIKRQL